MVAFFVDAPLAPPVRHGGEVVFNTAMTGYQEILTDPSYRRQIVTLTYPQIGNTGVNPEDFESDQVWAAGLVIRQTPKLQSNWRSRQTLSEFLVEQKTVAIADIDTRRLTRLIREKGAMGACILAGDEAADHDNAEDRSVKSGARVLPGLLALTLLKKLPVQRAWTQTPWDLASGYGELSDAKYHVVAYDFGVKRNILRILAGKGCRITVVPAQTTAEQVLAMDPDGVFLSNGPGDPEPCDYAISAIQQLLAARHADFWHLPGSSIAGTGQRRQDHENVPWASRRQPSGTGSRDWGGHDYQPESWLCCGCRQPARTFAVHP